MNLDISKAYDCCNWLYLRLILIHISFEVNTFNWIMCYLAFVSYAVIINGEASNFFKLERGLR